MEKYREDWLRRKGLLDPLSDEEKDAIVKREDEVKREEEPEEPKPQKRPKPKKVKAETSEPIGEEESESRWEKDREKDWRGYLDKKIDRLLDDAEIKAGSFVETNRWLDQEELKGGDLWDMDENLNKDPEDCPFEEDPSPSDPVNSRRPRWLSHSHKKKLRDGYKQYVESRWGI